MSYVFDKAYLDDVVECQGELCTVGVEQGYSLESILEVFMHSEIKSMMDRGYAVYLTMLGTELWELMDKNKLKKVQGKIDGSFLPEWLGCFYALLQWKSGLPSRKVIEKYPVKSIIKRYNVLHDLDLELAVDKVLRGDISE